MIASRIFALLPLAVLAVASGPQCNTGSASCCNSTQTAQQAQASGLLAKLGLSVGQITGLIGVDCTPITVIGTEGTCKATQEAVCCTDNGFQAGINLGCSPATANA